MTERNRIDFMKRLRIYEFLRHDDVLQPQASDPPTCKYIEPWSDRAVAEHFTQVFDSTVTEGNVEGIRLQAFGTLISNKLRLPGLDNIEAINELKQDIKFLQEENNELRRAHNELQQRVKQLELDVSTLKLSTTFKVRA